jgi:hypothetical protein
MMFRFDALKFKLHDQIRLDRNHRHVLGMIPVNQKQSVAATIVIESIEPTTALSVAELRECIDRQVEDASDAGCQAVASTYSVSCLEYRCHQPWPFRASLASRTRHFAALSSVISAAKAVLTVFVVAVKRVANLVALDASTFHYFLFSSVAILVSVTLS